MSKKSVLNDITRRNFLKIAGTAAGALTVPSQLLAFGAGERALDFSGWPAVRLGMLLPGKGFSPKLTENFLIGFDYCLKTSGCKDKGVSIELIKVDSGGPVSVSAMKKLLYDDKVTLVTGILNNAAASALGTFTRDEKFVLVAGSLGECMSRKTDLSPTTFHSSMNLWQSSWAMGRWAADNMGQNCVVASSLYDTGYDTLEAFRMGYQSAGGIIRETFITDASGTPNFDMLFSAIDATRPDFIYALNSGSQGADFMKAYASSGLSGRIPLACSSYLGGGGALTDMVSLASGIKTCLPFQSDFFASGSNSFSGKYAKATGRGLDAFSLLGYDTAGMILSALSSTHGKTNNISVLVRAFEGAAFSSPRGRLIMDPKTNATSGPLFIHEVGIVGGRPVTKAIAECSSPVEYDRRLQSLWVAGRTGWHDAYQYA